MIIRVSTTQTSWPTGAQLSTAAILGIVFGALSGGFAMALLITLACVATVGVWQCVTLLGYIAAQGDEQLAQAGRRGARR